MNQSKVNDPRFWKRWRASGAVGTYVLSAAQAIAISATRQCEAYSADYRSTVVRAATALHEWMADCQVTFVDGSWHDQPFYGDMMKFLDGLELSIVVQTPIVTQIAGWVYRNPGVKPFFST